MKRRFERPGKNNRKPKLSTIFAVAAGVAIATWVINPFSSKDKNTNTEPEPNEIAMSTFEDKVASDEINYVVLRGDQAIGYDTEVTPGVADYRTYVPDQGRAYETFKEAGAEEVKFEKPQAPAKDGTRPVLFNLLFLYLPAFYLFSFALGKLAQRNFNKSNDKMDRNHKSSNRSLRPKGGLGSGKTGAAKEKDQKEDTGIERPKVRLDDVAGIDEAKEEVGELIEFLKNPDKFSKLGAKVPKGALLAGAPGTGKTLLAKAVAGEANVPFFMASGSDFVEMYVGVGAKRMRSLFAEAKENAPCIVFIDEIDAVGGRRDGGGGSQNDERAQTLNALLVEMDGFQENNGVIVIGATNLPDALDPALLRPGRFDRQVMVPLPDIKGREKILEVHTKDKPLAEDVDLKKIAKATPGFSGAQIAALTNEAAIQAARNSQDKVTMENFSEAIDRIMMGYARTSMAMTEEQKKSTAYHEAGHALVGRYVPGNDPLHKVTVMPRGRSLGVTMNMPAEDKWNWTEKEMKAKLAMMFGGRVAEEMIYGKENISTGASNDIQQATKLARRMVTEFGFSDKLGRVRYASDDSSPFLAGGFSRAGGSYAASTADVIDQEVRRLIDEAENLAKEVLTKNRWALESLTEALMEHEIMSGAEVDALLVPEEKRRATTKKISNDNKEKPDGNKATGTAP